MSTKIDWVKTLKTFVAKHPKKDPQEVDEETDRLFLKYIEEDK